MLKKSCIVILMALLLCLTVSGAENDLPSLESRDTYITYPSLIDVRLSSNAVTVTEKGSFILVGSDGNASPTDQTQAAVMCCTDAAGMLLWRYEAGESNTHNIFHSVSDAGNGII